GRLAAARGHERRELLARHVLEQTAQALRLEAGQLDPTQGLFDLGMDSLMALDVRKRLESSLGLKLPTTLTFNYPTIDAIVGFLSERLEAEATTDAVPLAPVRGAATVPAPAAPRVDARPTSAPALDDLSEDELADLLAVKLEGLT
ncbi:MAG TPA: acyl carrier protein, partial [Vicinamibacterales bacterium]|nr:acyl carrier protein [Vicinamibacterales bacterium]